jgi:hypothetical protein
MFCDPYLGERPHESAVDPHQLLVGQHVPLVQDDPDLGININH